MGTYGEIVDQDLSAAFFEDLFDITRFFVCREESAVGFVAGHMLGKAIQDIPHFDPDLAFWDRSDGPNAIRLGVKRDIEPFADLALVNIKGCHDFDIVGEVTAHIVVHEPHEVDRLVFDGFLIGESPVVLDSLHERRRAISGAHDSDLDLTH